ncbi:MAG TPA: GNAT family protein [Caulobacteraceae bacterium]|jgi:RimJ/RimL family protein N-acetyltransferase|nr:GNAT family protein [Caulobacteraceae bacterium]
MLIGDKVCLGPVLQTDAPSFFNWLNSLDLVHVNGPYRPTDQARFDQWFGGIASDSTRVVFTIRAKTDVRLMGYIQIINIQPVARTAEMGILIGDPSDRGHGIGQEAVGLALKFCWRDLNLQRVALFIVGDNPPALNAYAKAGFEVEGRLRRAAYVNGAFHNITVMGVLRPDDVEGGPMLS